MVPDHDVTRESFSSFIRGHEDALIKVEGKPAYMLEIPNHLNNAWAHSTAIRNEPIEHTKERYVLETDAIAKQKHTWFSRAYVTGIHLPSSIIDNIEMQDLSRRQRNERPNDT